MASSGDEGDPYRYYLHGEEEKNTKWRYGAPPNHDVVNKFFEQGRTKIWPPGSLEEKVQNLVKTWEMEMFHKTSDGDYKTIDPNNYTFSVNGRKGVSLAEKRSLGEATTLCFKPLCLVSSGATTRPVDSSHRAFTTTFPCGFALEILHVYSGPPAIVYKFRHWGYMEGPFKGHALTGEIVELFGMAIFQVEFFFDRGELLGGLRKGAGASFDSSSEEVAPTCPYLRNTGYLQQGKTAIYSRLNK